MTRPRWAVLPALCMVLWLCADASAATQLAHPVSVKVKVGTTSATEAQAVSALASEDDILFDVTHELVGASEQLYTVTYIVRMKITVKPTNLGFQLNASTSGGSGCALGLDLFNWRKDKWVKEEIGTVTTSEALFSHSTVTSPAKYLNRGKMLGRIRCTNSGFFGDLRSDRIRAPAEEPIP